MYGRGAEMCEPDLISKYFGLCTDQKRSNSVEESSQYRQFNFCPDAEADISIVYKSLCYVREDSVQEWDRIQQHKRDTGEAFESNEGFIKFPHHIKFTPSGITKVPRRPEEETKRLLSKSR